MRSFSGNLSLSLLNIGYSDFNANWNWKAVYSPFARIYYVKKGTAKTIMNGKTYVLEPDHMYLTPPFTLHDDECEGSFSLFYIHFYEQAINKESVFDKYDIPVGLKVSELDSLLTERLLEINPKRELGYFDPKLYDNMPTFSRYIATNNKMPYHSVVETNGILHQLLSGFLGHAKLKPGSKDVRINNALKYIHENTDKDVSVAYLADVSCVTEDHFIRLFKKEMNCTPLKYILSKKIEKAQLLLITTDMPIRDVALELSFDNVSYFNKIFKHYTDKTPGKYRDEYL